MNASTTYWVIEILVFVNRCQLNAEFWSFWQVSILIKNLLRRFPAKLARCQTLKKCHVAKLWLNAALPNLSGKFHNLKIFCYLFSVSKSFNSSNCIISLFKSLFVRFQFDFWKCIEKIIIIKKIIRKSSKKYNLPITTQQ